MTKFETVSINELIERLPNGARNGAAKKLLVAYKFAKNAHAEQRRGMINPTENDAPHSAGLFIEHGLAIAETMRQLDVDINTLIAGLLHGILMPHSSATEADIEKLFGEDVLALVQGVDNLLRYARNKQKENGDDSGKLEALRRALLAIIEGNIRVILIRMADCLCDLRQSKKLTDAHRMKIANEAMHIYAPLTNRLGVWHLKWELEDLAFRQLNPDKYAEIAGHLAAKRGERTHAIDVAVKKLNQAVKEETDLNIDVFGRPKHIYSIYRKMQRKELGFYEIYDVQAIRVIIQPPNPDAYAEMNLNQKSREDRKICYQVLGVVHGLWNPIPKEFDDYIASPKSNGYRSLHTAVKNSTTGFTLEVQIRTQHMDEEAEKGVAAHWAYKEDGVQVSSSAKRRIQDLRDVLATLQESGEMSESEELLDKEIAAPRIHIFTPKGDVIALPDGSTPIDFAYHVHSKVGHMCRSARVNGKIVSLDYKLQSGDTVEISKGKVEKPSRDWMNVNLGYTGSASTRGKIRQWFRKQNRETNIEQGREVVKRELKRLSLSDTFSVEDISKALKIEEVEDFLAKVGFGDIHSPQISGALSLLERGLKSKDQELRPLLLPKRPKPKGLSILGASGMVTRLAKCCQPIPPVKIIGYITRGQGVTVHKRTCTEVTAIHARDEEKRLIDVNWGLDEEVFPIPVVVRAYRRSNLVGDMSQILRVQQIRAPSTKTISEGNHITIYLVVEVSNMNKLNWLMKKFENLPNVIEVRRQKWA